MGSWVRIRLFHILHFVRDLLFPLLKNSKPGVDDRGQCFRSGSPLTNYPHARATPGDLHVLTARGIGFSPNFLCQRGRGFELKKFSTVLKEKCKNFSNCFKEAGGSLKSRCSCPVSYQFLQKQ